jgi:hypothetical protein
MKRCRSPGTCPMPSHMLSQGNLQSFGIERIDAAKATTGEGIELAGWPKLTSFAGRVAAFLVAKAATKAEGLAV